MSTADTAVTVRVGVMRGFRSSDTMRVLDDDELRSAEVSKSS